MAEQRNKESTEVEIARLEEKLNNLNAIVHDLQKDRNSALKWGITILGTAVISMASWIFHHFVPFSNVKP